jgi:hypothetical protein
LKPHFLLFVLFFLFQTVLFSQALNIKERIDKQLTKITSDTIISISDKETLYVKLLEDALKNEYNNGVLNVGFKLMLMYSNLGQDKNVISIGNKIKKHRKGDDEDSKQLLARIYQINALA